MCEKINLIEEARFSGFRNQLVKNLKNHQSGVIGDRDFIMQTLSAWNDLSVKDMSDLMENLILSK